MTGAAIDTVIIACSVLLEPKLPMSSFNTRTWFSFWKSAALFWKAHMGDFQKNEDFSFSENNLNIKWYERKVNILKQAQW